MTLLRDEQVLDLRDETVTDLRDRVDDFVQTSSLPVATHHSFTIGHARIDCLSEQEAVARICELAGTPAWSQLVVTPNIQHVVELEHNQEFRAAYQSAALSLPDGWPLAAAARRNGSPGQQRVTGADLLPAVCEEAARRGLTVGIMGGQPGAAETCAKKFQERFPKLEVVFVHAAPKGFDESGETRDRLLSDLSARRPNILFVGFGAPRQEVFVHRNRPMANVVVGVGAALDFSAGLRRRAPRVVQRMGLEWLFRVALEPRRLWRRYAVAGPAFIRIVTRERRQTAVTDAA